MVTIRRAADRSLKDAWVPYKNGTGRNGCLVCCEVGTNARNGRTVCIPRPRLSRAFVD